MNKEQASHLSELRALLASSGAQVDEQDFPTMAKIVRAMPALIDVAEAAKAAREAHNRGRDGDRAKAMTALGIALHKMEEP